MKATLRVGYREEDGVVCGKAGLCGVEGVYPCVKFQAAIARRERWVVGDVVAAPHECINRAQSLSLELGKNKKSVVEILGPLASNSPANGVRHMQLRRCWQKLRRILRHSAH